MRLRQLERKDAEKMLAWMHDKSVVEKLQTNFAEKTLDDCIKFIDNSIDESNLHMAIVDEYNEYMGTVSLKHISKDRAEFAITICSEAMGKGYSSWAMKEILSLGFDKYNLKRIYWCVASNNDRALRFYDKNNYSRVKSETVRDIAVGYSQEQINKYIWYMVVDSRRTL